VKLPLSKPLFWQNQQLIESHQSKNDFIDIHFMDTRMPLTDLAFLGVPVKMYYSALGINIDFIIKQYELHRSEVHIEAEPGDFVIDAGGCFGDTALYFANKVGENGAVHVFEFIPDNIEVLKKNISLNMHLKQIIKLIPNPLWSSSGDDVFYASNGPASRVSMEAFEGYTNKTTTLSIDEYFRSEKIPVINFIKMDIEGAELNALKGAEDTIRQFKPKLAIALYHSTAEFDSIPRYINELNLGYKFYLSHSTIYGEETMLFATTEK
jgi:FkbM family methyltransferase